MGITGDSLVTDRSSPSSPSNLDSNSQTQLYQLLTERLPDTTIVSIADGEALTDLHVQRREMRSTSGGAYELHES
jgi:ABC-type uncharacterized transport system fused permease/ATPase subunit